MVQGKRVLLLTGRMAYDELVAICGRDEEVFVEALPISVAAFTTPKLVQRYLPNLVAKYEPDVVLVSGLSQGDYAQLEREIGTDVKKGTKKISSLPILFDNLEEIWENLSSCTAADPLLERHILMQLKERIKEAEEQVVFGKRNFHLKSGLAIGIDLPPRVMAEVVDATIRPIETSIQEARRYAKWADIIDLGGSVAMQDPDRIAELVQEIRKLGLPVSVDSLDPREIHAAVDAGAEIVLSIDYGNQDVLSKIPEDVALVVLPTNVDKGLYPQDPMERARKCTDLCNDLRKHGYDRLLADTIMEAAIRPGLMRSLLSFHRYRELDPDTPSLAGFGNVTEFIDTDTMGVNALLASLGIELGISVFLTTEERPSTVNCVKELQSTVKMTYVANLLDSTPKEIGISSFSAKSGKHNLQSTIYDASYIHIKQNHERGYDPDPKGSFRVGIDHTRGLILCEHKGPTGEVLKMASESASTMLTEIIDRGLISYIEHAAYLGKELSKAEIAIKIGHDFQQDEVWASFSISDVCKPIS